MDDPCVLIDALLQRVSWVRRDADEFERALAAVAAEPDPKIRSINSLKVSLRHSVGRTRTALEMLRNHYRCGMTGILARREGQARE